MSETGQFARAFFTLETGAQKGTTIEVHFNPASLEYTITNTLEQKGNGNSTKQFVSQSSGKLTMELVFDTTDDGQDVRDYTTKMSRLMEPEGTIPAIVQFEWGVYTFRGMVESYKETLDFFAPSGVPLRAAINLTLASQDTVFETGPTDSRVDTQGALGQEPLELPSGAAAGGAAGIGALAGNPRAAREIAGLNGEASLRFSSGAPLAVGGSVELSQPVAFASGGSLSVGGSASLGLGGGAGIQIGGAASAGVSASGGAFAGLRAAASARGPSSPLDLQRLLPRNETVGLATDRGASFGIGGRARVEGAASLSADVGASANLRARIRFQGG